MSLIEKYIESCNYPNTFNEVEIKKSLKSYLKCLGIKRKIIRLSRNWDVFNYPDILRNLNEVLGKINAQAARDARAARDALAALAALAAQATLAARDALDARAALDALDARVALAATKKFSRFLVNGYGYWSWSWEMSWVVTTWIGAIQLEKEDSLRWSEYLFNAFLSGCWFLYWTNDTLYWFSKPTCKSYEQNNRKVLHCTDGPALMSDWTDLYYLNGVMVDKEIVMTSAEDIDPNIILTEKNVEIRREIVRKIGIERVIKNLGAETLEKGVDHAGNPCELLLLNMGDGRKRPYIKLINPSIGTYHIEGVHPECLTLKKAWNFRNGNNENPVVLT